jgi:hypothetical protein
VQSARIHFSTCTIRLCSCPPTRLRLFPDPRFQPHDAKAGGCVHELSSEHFDSEWFRDSCGWGREASARKPTSLDLLNILRPPSFIIRRWTTTLVNNLTEVLPVTT